MHTSPISRLFMFLAVAGGVLAGPANSFAAGPRLLVANQDDRTLSVIDPADGRLVTAVAETGVTGHEVGVDPALGTAYVPIYGNSGVGKPGTDGTEIDVIDVASGKVTGRIDLGHGVRPHCILFDPASGMLYVTTELDKTVTVIDPRTLKVVATVPTGQAESHMLAISRDGKRGYTANVGPGTVSVLDLAARRTLTTIPISSLTQRISISSDDSMVFTADQTKPQLAVIDTAANKVRTSVELPGLGYGTAPTQDGHTLLVTIPGKNEIAVVDLVTFKVIHTIPVGTHPTEVLVRPDGAKAYVSCQGSHQVAVLDLKQWKLDGFIEAGKGADGLAWLP